MNDSGHLNRSIGCSIIVGLAIIAGLFWVFRMEAVLIVLLALVCFFCYVFVNKDDPPFESTRVGGAILTAWAADAILYRVALDLAPREYRHMTFGIIALSVYVGWLAWRVTGEYVATVKRRDNGTIINRLAPFTGVLLGVFIMTNIVHPTISHYFPSFWKSTLDQARQGASSDDDTEP